MGSTILLQTPIEYAVTGGYWNSEYQVNLNGSTLYHVVNESPTPDKPNITFFAGSSTDGPIVGSGVSIPFSSDIQITLGDPGLPKTVTSTKLSKKGFISTRYVFELEIDYQMRTFAWKDTSLNESFGPAGSHKLVDEANEIVAVFSPGGGRVKKDGALNVHVDLGETFILMALLTALVLREKVRRSAGGLADNSGMPSTYVPG
ncbi:uncharacterized protein N7496_010075 [Penicillium cataractarum]|uniref:Uncharacterized protein n=1 Tax=Penicillium cataractarum TaxID=2100454 RepID=A0A9W9V0J3_9EURO|nr:uncharacterized protein N7496_010075 [Penicillium cataractarum]KAJ5364362.1 hypothetical protein N7496_010075 [Penicillium cataractarum]